MTFGAGDDRLRLFCMGIVACVAAVFLQGGVSYRALLPFFMAREAVGGFYAGGQEPRAFRRVRIVAPETVIAQDNITVLPAFLVIVTFHTEFRR